MTFSSILFPGPAGPSAEEAEEAMFWGDLRLDQIVAAVVAGREEYRLEPLFRAPLRDAEAIAWRQEIMRDLEDSRLSGCIQAFAQGMRTMRARLARADALRGTRAAGALAPAPTIGSVLQQQRWFLDAVDAYCGAVTGLGRDLAAAPVRSRGLVAFREFLGGYIASPAFTALLARAQRLIRDLAAIRYVVSIQGLWVRVRRDTGDPDYSVEVEAAFAAFPRGSVEDRVFRFLDLPELNPVEARILALVAGLYPEVFAPLEAFHRENRDFQHAAIAGFDREIQFYIAYLEHIAGLKAAGLSFCYPRLAPAGQEVYCGHGFDLALAGARIRQRDVVVCNDVHLGGSERLLVISGPNQGGKTTFARALGQLHYLAALGCPVPGTRAQVLVFDQLFTHFERVETVSRLGGKLHDDLLRAHRILERATPHSIVILNEIFASTTLRDAIDLSAAIAAKIDALGALCVWVTFVDELASLNERTVSMAGLMDPAQPALRTFKFTRRPADGRAYALALAEAHQLTYADIRARMGGAC